MALIFRGSSLKKLVSVYASSHDSHVDMKTRPSTRSTEKQGAYRLREGRGEESARAVCASRKNDFTFSLFASSAAASSSSDELKGSPAAAAPARGREYLSGHER